MHLYIVFSSRKYHIGIPTFCLKTRPPSKTRAGGRYQFQRTFWKNQSVVSQNTIYPFLRQGICIYVGHLFYEPQLD